MYTVARFLVGPEQLGALTAIGEAMNAVRPGNYRGPRAHGDGIALDVADGDSWADQSASILTFVRMLREQIGAARALGASATVDVAIEPEDLGKIPLVLRAGSELLGELASAGMALEVSLYVSSDKALPRAKG